MVARSTRARPTIKNTVKLSGYASLFGSPTAQMLFVSNATTTLALGVGGAYAYTTDGINWTPGFIDPYFMSTNQPTGVYHDGSRFVLIYSGATYYSGMLSLKGITSLDYIKGSPWLV